jgi:hypothetical protein
MPVPRHDKILLLALTISYLVLMIGGGLNVKVSFQAPHDSAAAAGFVTQHGGAIRLGSFLELVSAIPLGMFMAVTLSRLRSLGIRHAGEEVAALGGIATPMMLAGAAMATWSLTRPGVASGSGAVAVLQAIGFDSGGPGFAVFLGLFVAGVSVAGGLRKLIPRWLMWLGFVVAATGELSTFTLLDFTAGYFIPVARFLSIVWMAGLALNLPTGIPV